MPNTPTELIKYMDIVEFRDEGYLQEVNRQFFHPLGMALEVKEGDDGVWRLSGVWDYRDDPEGMNYVDGMDLQAKAQRVLELWEEKELTRLKTLGYMIQPVDDA